MSKSMRNKNIAIVLAAGKGSRMDTATPKQFMQIKGKPLMYYCLATFEKSEVIDEIILVTNESSIDYVREEIVKRFAFNKVSKVVSGGNERVYSVWEGLKAIQGEMGYVFIHDSARPLVTEDTIKRLAETVIKTKACVAAVQSKDTVKICDESNYIKETPIRETVWIIQTPQVFKLSTIYKAYESIINQNLQKVTDDAMVLEMTSQLPIKLVEATYENIKVTTPEDIEIAEAFMDNLSTFFSENS